MIVAEDGKRSTAGSRGCSQIRVGNVRRKRTELEIRSKVTNLWTRFSVSPSSLSLTSDESRRVSKDDYRFVRSFRWRGS